MCVHLFGQGELTNKVTYFPKVHLILDSYFAAMY